MTSFRTDKLNYLNFPSLKMQNPFPKVAKSSKNFLKRNFYDIVKTERELIQNKKSVINKTDLSSMLLRLKKIYNQLNKESMKRNNEIASIKEINVYYSKKIYQIEKFSDMIFPNEKVSVKNLSYQKQSKEEIEKRVISLLEEKAELEEKFRNEVEYMHTIEHMIEKERLALEELNETLLSKENKRTVITNVRKSLDTNEIQKAKKKRNFSEVILQLQNEITGLSDLVTKQDLQFVKLHTSLDMQGRYNEELKDKISEQKIKDQAKFRAIREDVVRGIKEMEEIQSEKIAKEQSNIKLVLGLYLIKRFFLDADAQGVDINISDVVNSADYKSFCAEKYQIFDHNDGLVSYWTPQCTPSSPKHNPRRGISLSQTRISHPSHNSPLHSRQSSKNENRVCKISLSELKDKFDCLNFDYARLYEFYSKITTRISFNRQSLIILNDKQIQLENRKNSLAQRVKDIISFDYKNFDDLIKMNSRFESFMRKNDTLLQCAKEKREKDKDSKLKKEIVNIDDAEGVICVCASLSDQLKKFYKKTEKFISDIKLSFEISLSSYKKFASECGIKEIQDMLRQINRKIRRSSVNKIIEYGHQADAKYIEDLFGFLQKDPDVYSHVDAQAGEGSIKRLLEYFFQCQNHEKNRCKFLSLKISLEKVIFYFFTDITSRTELIEIYYRTINYLQNPEFEVLKKNTSAAFSRPKNEDKLTFAEIESLSPKARAPSFALNSNAFEHLRLDDGQTNDAAHHSQQSENNQTNDDSYQSANDGIMRTSMTASYLTGTAPSHYRGQSSNINERIIEKLYSPFINAGSYNMQLNKNIRQIKRNTKQSFKINFMLNKKKKEIESTAKELIIYSNPKINIETLSNNTYNFYVKQILEKQLLQLKKRNPKEDNSTRTIGI